MTGRKKSKPNFFPSNHPIPEGMFDDQLSKSTPVMKYKKASITAITPTQKTYLHKLQRRHHDILFATGPAGTGKTYAACVFAIQQLQEGKIDKIIITRPNVGAGDDLGFLPGDMNEKMAPWTLPVMDVFKEFYPAHEVNRMVKEEIIEIAPLVYMRGRTLKHCIVIADEMQNSTPEQMKMFLTRIGEDCMMIVTGDVTQHDRGYGVSGLGDIIDRLTARDSLTSLHTMVSEDNSEQGDSYEHTREHRRIGLIRFGRADVVRHEVIGQVLGLYDEE